MNLTIILWTLSWITSVMAFLLTRKWITEESDIFAKCNRVVFCFASGMAFWASTTYLFWGLGFKIEIGTVENGLMDDHWWLPGATVLFAMLTYLLAKPSSDS